MSTWHTVLDKPTDLDDRDDLQPWFAQIAQCLLNEATFMIAGRPHRLVEVECYYHGPGHLDPFSHCNPVQCECGRWYFHKSGRTYRAGSFKGLDLSFGHNGAFAGVLFRSLETPDGELITGPSLCVDYILGCCQCASVAELEARIAGRLAFDGSNILQLRNVTALREHTVYATGRIGLTLKRARLLDAMPKYVSRAYRFLTELKRVSKGKPLLVVALHTQGLSMEDIIALTGSPRRSVQRYLDDFQTGCEEKDFDRYLGKDLTTSELCRLQGTWHQLFGAT